MPKMAKRFLKLSEYIQHLTRHDVVVDVCGIFQSDRGIYNAEYPYGPFTCVQRGAEYGELEDLEA